MTLFVRLSLVVASAFALTSCQTVPEEPPTAYGAFLVAQYAQANRDVRGAADHYAQALDLAPGSPVLAERAFTSAIVAGELRDAGALADAAILAGDESRFASIYRASDLIAERRYQQALDVLENAPDMGIYSDFTAELHGFAVEALTHWALVGMGRGDEARNAARLIDVPGYFAPFTAAHRAMIADAMGDRETADRNYLSAVYSSPFQRMMTALYGGFLERGGQREEAEALYATYLRNTPGDEVIEEAYQRVLSGGRAPQRPDISEAAGLSLFGPSASLAAQADLVLTVLYLRMVERLYPDYAPNRILLGESLQRIYLPYVAIEQYEAVAPGPYWDAAQIDLIWLTGRLDRIEEATAQAEALVAGGADEQAKLILADLYRVQDRCGDAIPLYTDVIEERREAGAGLDWRYPYFRASCHYVVGDLAAAERDYQRALELGPNEAQVLNDLGYLWLETGVRLEEAFSMVERAADLEPQEGHIVDSLGWAYYLLGDYESAVMELERAVLLAPGNPTINFHLGDAYWQVGRRLESRFQWERALTLDPDDSERAALEERLAHGLITEEDTGRADNEAGSSLP